MERKREKAKTRMEPINGLLTLEEVCRFLHVHKNTLRRWSDQGIIKAYSIGLGRQRRFKREDIVAFIREEPVKLRVDTSKLRKFPKRAKRES